MKLLNEVREFPRSRLLQNRPVVLGCFHISDPGFQLHRKAAMLFISRSKARRHGILLDHPQDGDQRCFNCGGDCCRSFADVELTWDEYERLRELGASRLQLSLAGPHRLLIDYGCEFLKSGRCSIYEARPEICRRFTCTD